MLAPYSDFATPRGWSRHECTTLRECYQFQRRWQEQELEDARREGVVSLSLVRERFRRTRDSMLARMASSSTTPFDRDFMAAYLQLQEEKLEKHERNFEHRVAYLWVLEHDVPKGRRDDEESFNVDRIG